MPVKSVTAPGGKTTSATKATKTTTKAGEITGEERRISQMGACDGFYFKSKTAENTGFYMKARSKKNRGVNLENGKVIIFDDGDTGVLVDLKLTVTQR